MGQGGGGQMTDGKGVTHVSQSYLVPIIRDCERLYHLKEHRINCSCTTPHKPPPPVMQEGAAFPKGKAVTSALVQER